MSRWMNEGYENGYGKWDAQIHDGHGRVAEAVGIVAVLSSPLLGGFLLGPIAMLSGVLGRERAQRGVATNGAAAVAGIRNGKISLEVSAAFLVVYISLAVLL